MKNLDSTAYGPEQLGLIREAFDQACSRLTEGGHGLGTGALNELATFMLKMGAKGLSGNELVEAAVSSILLRKRGV